MKHTMPKAGDRVFAIMDADSATVRLFGSGVYVGDEKPDKDQHKFGMVGMLAKEGIENPRINLDNGDVVWGCECWWGPEDELEEILKGKAVAGVTVAEFRAQAEAEERKMYEDRAGHFYETYCKAVGGVAFNGDPLPSWAEFRADTEKLKQSNAWLAVAMSV